MINRVIPEVIQVIYSWLTYTSFLLYGLVIISFSSNISVLYPHWREKTNNNKKGGLTCAVTSGLLPPPP